MSTAKSNATPAAAVEEKATVPAQKTVAPSTGDIQKVVEDVVAAVKEKQGLAMTVTVKLDENDGLEIDVHEVPDGGKVKKLVTGAKGIFTRNKKLVLATAGLAATSVLLKVIASRQEVLEDDEVVETSDDVATDA